MKRPTSNLETAAALAVVVVVHLFVLAGLAFRELLRAAIDGSH